MFLSSKCTVFMEDKRYRSLEEGESGIGIVGSGVTGKLAQLDLDR